MKSMPRKTMFTVKQPHSSVLPGKVEFLIYSVKYHQIEETIPLAGNWDNNSHWNNFVPTNQPKGIKNLFLSLYLNSLPHSSFWRFVVPRWRSRSRITREFLFHLSSAFRNFAKRSVTWHNRSRKNQHYSDEKYDTRVCTVHGWVRRSHCSSVLLRFYVPLLM